MKELSIEEKAQRYDEAFEKAKNYHSPETLCNVRIAVENLFPELKESESEGESIRKELIEFVKSRGGFKQEYIAWLEKQGENKDILEDAVLDSNEDGLIADTIKYKNEQKPADSRQETKPNGEIVYEDFNEGDGYYKVNLSYLSKSQVELIENLVAFWQNPTNSTSEWSEEDERMWSKTIFELAGFTDNEDKIDWLDSLKKRAQAQPKQEWSEEDDFMVENVRNSFGLHCGQMTDALKEQYDKFFNKVKYLRPQSTWKPSDEQMKALGVATNISNVPEKEYQELEKLYQDLKKLKGE